MMGMNRYGMVSANLVNDRVADHNLNVDGNSDIAKNLAQYNINKGIRFEANSTIYKQGYTFWCICGKIGQNGSDNGEVRAPYKYLIKDPENGKTYEANRGGQVSRNMQTDRAYRLNKGQITEYPFNIPEVLSVARTHGQYYMLNMEDPELTVWYTLEDAKPYGGTSTRDNNWLGLVYGVTPHNAAGNFYIYSKGNIFYSGVGHSAISGDPERKLFVNTLIAAYRPVYENPEVFITNPDATKTARREYVMRVDQEFDYDDAETLHYGDVAGDDDIEVIFYVRDYSGSPTVRCSIFYEGGTKFFGTDNSSAPATSRIYEVVTAGGVKTRGSAVTARATESGSENFYILDTEKEYMIVYPKSNIKSGNDAWNHIMFDARNDRVLGESEITDLYMKPRPLFFLD
jgi:hypothetical protein